MTRNFKELIQARWDGGARVCVGLDPDVDKIDVTSEDGVQVPLTEIAGSMYRQCGKVVDETADIALAYKPNFAFFARANAYDQLAKLIHFIRWRAPDVPVILDVKRGDIGNTNKGYVAEAFDINQADAVTISPYLGYEAMKPFLADPNKFAFVLCKTSNEGSGEFQDRLVLVESQEERSAFGKVDEPSFVPLYQIVAHRVARHWNENGNVGLVVGATYPDQLAAVRDIVGNDMWILVPGVGSQGGDVEATVRAGGNRIVVNASSSIMFPKTGTIREAAQDLHNQLTACQVA